MKASEVLRNAFGMFGPNGEHWQRHTPIGAMNHCSISAIYKASGGTGSEDGESGARYAAWDALKAAAGIHHDDLIQRWNDATERTWPEVKAAFEKAIQNCEAIGQ